MKLIFKFAHFVLISVDKYDVRWLENFHVVSCVLEVSVSRERNRFYGHFSIKYLLADLNCLVGVHDLFGQSAFN